ncbi:MAG: uncharacterized protein QOC61_1124 [Acidobacteriota bacterium]|jgi:GNAT superfamily N-acetyltransferase|nr:uncharacterized protein [Acidobacteriota bacterium]MDT7777944.1 uncharacterized protein [Acidobacteriota bacterium]
MFQLMTQPHTHAGPDTFGAFSARRSGAACEVPRAEPLKSGSGTEVLAFLSERPVHAVNLISLIRDNGFESPLNRGTFYACRDAQGALEGVALIGHATLVEARTPRALKTFALKAQECASAHMIMGESGPISEFWGHYSGGGGQRMRLAGRELLFELGWPVEMREEVAGLRPATHADLDLIMPVQAQMAEEESGINPLVRDPEGFRRRCEHRIDCGRTWVLVEGGRLVFKAEVISETPDATYLEGVHVDAGERGKGYGLRCLSQMTRELLRRTHTVCILVNEKNKAAQAFYRKAGFRFSCQYDTIFLQQYSQT